MPISDSATDIQLPTSSVWSPTQMVLGDLVAQDALGLQLVVGADWGDAALGRPVAVTHSLDGTPGSLASEHAALAIVSSGALETHLRHGDDVAAALARSEACALAITGVSPDEVPDTLTTEASRLLLPVVVIPERTRVSDVVAAVYRGLLSQELRVSQRLGAVQAYLIDALGDENPVDQMARRLAEMLEARVVILGAGGDPVIGDASLPTEQILDQIRAKRCVATAFDVDELHGVAFPVSDANGRPSRWLVVASSRRRTLPGLLRPAAQAVVSLIRAVDRLSEIRDSQTRAVRRSLTRTLLEARDTSSAHLAAAQARAVGLHLDLGVQTVIVPVAGEPSDASVALEQIESSLVRSGVPFVGDLDADGICLIVPEGLAGAVVASITTSDAHATGIGLGRPVSTAPEIVGSRADAVLAAQMTNRRGRGQVVRYEDLDLDTVILNEIPLDRLAPKMMEWLEPLRANPIVCEAVEAYLRFNLDIGQTARHLHLHANSVRYRLTRAEEIIGASLRSPRTLLALQLALLSADEWSAPPVRLAPSGLAA